MSSTFDAMQQALSWLKERADPDDTQVADVIHYCRLVIRDLHDESHAQQDALNVICWDSAAHLRIAIRHKDDEDRELYLQAQGGA